MRRTLPPLRVKGERMPVSKMAAITVVKELRLITGLWVPDGEYRPYEQEAARVKKLVEMLPSFRAAPQTQAENTLRAIEALFVAHMKVDPTKEPVDWSQPAYPKKMLVAIGRIINTSHKVNPPPVVKGTPKKYLKVPPKQTVTFVIDDTTAPIVQGVSDGS